MRVTRWIRWRSNYPRNHWEKGYRFCGLLLRNIVKNFFGAPVGQWPETKSTSEDDAGP